MWYLPLLEKGLIPDTVLKLIIKILNRQKLQSLKSSTVKENEFLQQQIALLKESPLAIKTDSANQQHYEVPAEFFTYVLGENLKYSSAYWEKNYAVSRDLDLAEKKMLSLYSQRGEFTNGQKILELGCGWGSLTFFLAQHFPKSKITAVSNSKVQKAFIVKKAKKLKIKNIQVITEDINRLKLKEKFDRIVSIEMFEHLRNYKMLFERLNNWLKADGKLFIHIFCHQKYTYPFEVKDSFDWMSKYFFSGGIMPSKELFLYFAAPLKLEKMWLVNGEHYAKTAEAWLYKHDASQEKIQALFKGHYQEEAKKYFYFWRIFFLAVKELFAYDKGNEWLVAHYLFSKK